MVTNLDTEGWLRTDIADIDLDKAIRDLEIENIQYKIQNGEIWIPPVRKPSKKCIVCGEWKEPWEIKYGGICVSCAKKLKRYTKEERAYYDWALQAIKSHKRRGIIVDIPAKRLVKMAKSTKYCPLCGRELDWERFKEKNKVRWKQGLSPSDDTPTLDRIDNATYLTEKDVMITCYRCNVMKNNTPLEEFIRNCKRITFHTRNI